ncbi:MAG TPA: hypothetical protein VN648_35470 [Candidatus Methylomirabilis sp.]|nr:hypothetical protein [Candidatus Methylomirabilis sp.]
MAGKKYDGVIEAVRYAPDGKISTVRVYERRGPTFSDRLLLTREALIDRLKSGKIYVTGQRKALLASTFEVSGRVRILKNDGQEYVVGENETAAGDRLPGVPLF